LHGAIQPYSGTPGSLMAGGAGGVGSRGGTRGGSRNEDWVLVKEPTGSEDMDSRDPR
jgi:hypothetical protein